MNFCCLLIFLKINFFENKSFRNAIRVKCQTVWTQIRPNILVDLIWVQTVAKISSRQQNLQLAVKEIISQDLIDNWSATFPDDNS